MCRSVLTLIVLSWLAIAQLSSPSRLESALVRSGVNRAELDRALGSFVGERRESLSWLLERMPDVDLRSLDANYLIENVNEAHDGFEAAPWRSAVSVELFRDAILPYASVSEKRERWRKDFRKRFSSVVLNAKTAGEAAVLLNQRVFSELKVKYSTQRARADQGPLESMASGLASCTGLTVILVDACRAVGVPARFAGTALWSDGSGNHSWTEVWDGSWKYTGAAEPTGDRLNEGWFADRAAKAITGDAKRGIYAVTWGDSPLSFPMVWAPGDHSVRGIDVSERYKTPDLIPAGMARVRFRIRSGAPRVALKFDVVDGEGRVLKSSESRDDRFDANDHATLVLTVGASLRVRVLDRKDVGLIPFVVKIDEQLVDLNLAPSDASAARAPQTPLTTLPTTRGQAENPVEALSAFIREGGTLQAAATRPFARLSLSKEECASAKTLLVAAHHGSIRRDRKREATDRVLEFDGKKMPYWYAAYGERPARGRSLWISMHGGGGAPAKVNDQQWENQKRLYRPSEGIYVAPRAPTDTWDLWHQPHIDRLFDRLIENMVAFEGVDPDRVYLMGYSAGGDGAFQLAPRIADRWAAAAMMAGHPGDASPLGLRNLPFTIHVGGRDAAYDRNKHASEWKVLLDGLSERDPNAYPHWVLVHETKGHWMDREDAAAVPWMAKYTRNLRPDRIVWKQDDVLAGSSYWLAASTPKPRSEVVALRQGQVVRVSDNKGFEGSLLIRLDDTMVDFEKDVVVTLGDREAFRGRLVRTLATMISTLLTRGDTEGVFPAEIAVGL